MILVDLAQIAPILKRAGCFDAVLSVVAGTPVSLRIPSPRHPTAPVRRPVPRTGPRLPLPRVPVLPPSLPRRGPRVRYRSLVPLTAPAVQRLPPHDLRVYRLIRQVPSGVTRLQLIAAMRAHQHTGKVDGAVRRLRLKKMITVTPTPV